MIQSQITQLIRELITTMGYHCDDVELREDQLTKTLIINIVGQEITQLIGHEGEGIHALRHIIQRILDLRSKNNLSATQECTPFTLDIENYYSRALEQLKKRVLARVELVRTEKESQILDPMTAYERLVVHAFLSPYLDITTSSHGEGEKRHIIIEYRDVSD